MSLERRDEDIEDTGEVVIAANELSTDDPEISPSNMESIHIQRKGSLSK
jgi:hypothetical protein